MGAIVLNNYVASSGSSCALDAAFSISGALDCRQQLLDWRSKMLWQPLLADGLKANILFGKHGKKLKERMSNWEYIQLLRASSVVVRTYKQLATAGLRQTYTLYLIWLFEGGRPMDGRRVSWIR